jgi:hypothetical protein
LGYITTAGNERRKLPAADVIHIKGLGFDGMAGYSVIFLLRESLGMGMALTAIWKQSILETMVAPGPVVIEMPPGSRFKDQEEIELFKKHWNGIHQGLTNAHKIAVLPPGFKLNRTPINNEDAQWLNSREFEVRQVANIIGVPPHKLGSNINTSYASLEQENKSFLEDSLEPWLTAWEEELEAKLLQESQKIRDSHDICFDRSMLTKPDAATASTIAINEFTNGLVTLNEYLQSQNKPGIGSLGDKRIIKSGLMLLDDIEKEDPPAPLPQQQPPGQQLPQQQPDDNQEEDTSQRFRQLVTLDVGRQLKRISKALEGATKKEDYQPRKILQEHRGHLHESLGRISEKAGGVLDSFLAQLAEELSAVTRDQVEVVLSRYSAEELAERLI